MSYFRLCSPALAVIVVLAINYSLSIAEAQHTEERILLTHQAPNQGGQILPAMFDDFRRTIGDNTVGYSSAEFKPNEYYCSSPPCNTYEGSIFGRNEWRTSLFQDDPISMRGWRRYNLWDLSYDCKVARQEHCFIDMHNWWGPRLRMESPGSGLARWDGEIVPPGIHSTVETGRGTYASFIRIDRPLCQEDSESPILCENKAFLSFWLQQYNKYIFNDMTNDEEPNCPRSYQYEADIELFDRPDEGNRNTMFTFVNYRSTTPRDSGCPPDEKVNDSQDVQCIRVAENDNAFVNCEEVISEDIFWIAMIRLEPGEYAEYMLMAPENDYTYYIVTDVDTSGSWWRGRPMRVEQYASTRAVRPTFTINYEGGAPPALGNINYDIRWYYHTPELIDIWDVRNQVEMIRALNIYRLFTLSDDQYVLKDDFRPGDSFELEIDAPSSVGCHESMNVSLNVDQPHWYVVSEWKYRTRAGATWSSYSSFSTPDTVISPAQMAPSGADELELTAKVRWVYGGAGSDSTRTVYIDVLDDCIGRETSTISDQELVLVAPDEDGSLPDRFALGPNVPNPLRDHAAIRIALPEDAYVMLELFDVLGRRVEVLWDGELSAGYHAIQIQVGHLPNGLYSYRIAAIGSNNRERFTQSRQMTIVR